jgi:multidrug resistance efflux pump
MTIKQKNSIFEEELTHSQRRCHKAEKALQQLKMKEQQKDNSLLKRILCLKQKKLRSFKKSYRTKRLKIKS